MSVCEGHLHRSVGNRGGGSGPKSGAAPSSRASGLRLRGIRANALLQAVLRRVLVVLLVALRVRHTDAPVGPVDRVARRGAGGSLQRDVAADLAQVDRAVGRGGAIGQAVALV